MADYQRKQGTQLTWTSSGGDYALTLSSLTNTSIRQGAKGDLGSSYADVWNVELVLKTGGSAPDAGKTYDVYWAASGNATAGTDNPGGASGSDAAYTGYSSNGDASLKNLEFIGSLVTTNLANQVHRMTVGKLAPTMQYGMPVVRNSSGQTSGTTGTDHKVVLTPAPFTDA